MKIFTDGGCIRNGKTSAIGSYGIFFDDKNFKFSNVSGLIRRFDYKIKNDLLTNGTIEIAPTNIRAELFAIILALYLVKTYNGAKTIEIITDSEFSINVCTKWITNWQVNKFNGKKNPDLLTILFDLLHFHTITFVHVNSHTGGESENEIGNAVVDKLASDALKYDDYKMRFTKN